MALKIVFDANPLTAPKSGVGHYTQRLIESLAQVSPDAELVGYYFNFLGRNHFDDLPSAPNIRYVQSKLIPGKLLNLCRRLGFQLPLRLITGQKADVALFTNFVALPTPRKTLSVSVIYDLSFIDCPEYVADKNRDFLRRWVPKTIKKASGVVVNSDFIKSQVIHTLAVSEDMIHVMPIPPASVIKSDNSILEKLGLTDPYLLFVGTIEPRKNVIGLVNAYALLPKELQKKYSLVLAGRKGWHDQEILERIEELKTEGLNIIQIDDFTDAGKAALYEKALLYLQPSHYEGFGMPVLEAMSFGKAVACSDIAVLHEVAGDAAVYFDQNDPQAMADIIASLATNPEKLEEGRKRAHMRIANYPTWGTVTKDFYDYLKKLADQG